jgi:CheY-like chemotaxis protein
VRVDRTKLEQVLLNLVINARDAMAGEGRLRIATACGQRNEEATVALIVEDNGTGMEPEVERRCFEPFFTTKGPGEGTGLGLSTVYGIVSQSGGTVTVDTAPGAGCRIRIDLPAVEASDADTGDQAHRGPSAGTETLLLVEDEEPVRRLAAQALRRGGYHVLSAADGEQALDVARAHAGEIQLLVTDVVMPKLGGRELARRLHADRPDLPVLYLSGYAPDGLLTDGSSSEAADFLQKPFSPQHLSTAVRRILDHRRVS